LSFAVYSLALLDDATIIDSVNKINAGWKAELNKEVKPALGAFMTPAPKPLPEKKIDILENLPATFDSRQQWPGCIGGILNQGECGSCWAFGTCETLSDRFCIHSNGSVNVSLSELDLVTCDNGNSGCEGGWPDMAWDYAIQSGLVTNDCIPYNSSIPSCVPSQQPCLNFVPTPPCPKKCSNGMNWKSDLYYAKNGYAVADDVKTIQTEMFQNGPVQALFNVYQDFLHYKSGVYRHIYGGLVGGHSVKIIGWGVLNNEDYWLVQNSWTASWGDNGYFMILRGVNECGIENGIYAGEPNLEKLPY